MFERSLEIRVRVLGPEALRLGVADCGVACIDALQGDRRGALGNLRLALGSGWRWLGVESTFYADRGRVESELRTTE
jgi:hypothetical protein